MPKWRNGRRKGLKILRWKHHAGSSPALGTRCDGFIRLFLLRRRSFLFRRPSPGAAMRQNYNRGRFFQTAKNRQTFQFYPKKKYELPSNEKFVFFYRNYFFCSSKTVGRIISDPCNLSSLLSIMSVAS